LAIQDRLHVSDKEQDGSFIIRLVLLALFFSAGVILGQVLSGHVPEETSEELSRYLTAYVSVGKETEMTLRTFLSAVMIYFHYPLLVLLLGFASVGIVLIPLLSLAYGFFLSFSVCCFTPAFGQNGVLLALSVFGLRCLVTLPCFFLLAVPSFQNAVSLALFSFGRGNQVRPVHCGTHWWLRLGVVLLLLLAGVVTELFVTPYLLHSILAKIIV